MHDRETADLLKIGIHLRIERGQEALDDREASSTRGHDKRVRPFIGLNHDSIFLADRTGRQLLPEEGVDGRGQTRSGCMLHGVDANRRSR